MVAVTGASGFLGAALCGDLHSRGFTVRGVVRSLHHAASASVIEPVAVGNLDAATDWSSAFVGVDCVIHCAARAHVTHETELDALAAYREVNVDGSRRLAEQAGALGVRRLVFLSSIKVNGEQTVLGDPFTVKNEPAPEDPYGISKWEAEQALWAVSARSGLEVVVVRPPLVYGPGVKGNLLRLLQLVFRRVPLPLGAIQNQRSLIGLDNLVNLLIRSVDHPAAVGQTLLVSDRQDLSTPELIRKLAHALDQPFPLFSVPPPLLRIVGQLTGKSKEMDRLLGSLQIDPFPTCKILNWSPPISLDEGLRKTAAWYLSQT